MAMKYFISYTQKDERWATWIADVLNEHGQTPLYQSENIIPGDNFISEMHKLLNECDVCITVLSEAYFKSDFCELEWTNALGKAIKGKTKRVIPVRISDIEPDGILYGLVYIDLYGIRDESIAINKLLEGLKIKEKASTPHDFPGAAPASPFVAGAGDRFPGALPPNNLQDRNEYFTGRSEILEIIHTTFSQKNTNSLNAAFLNTVSLKQTITGLGGVGKTQIALEYAYRFGNGYNDALWWVIAETEMSAMSGFLSFAEHFGLIPEGLDEARKLTVEQLSKRLSGWFATHSSWLFIFDNVEQIEVIKHYTDVMKTGHIIITTRDQELRKGKLIDIDLFTPAEAADFMRTRLTECSYLIENETVLSELIDRLDCFPLALAQAAAYMDRVKISCNQYLSLLDSSGIKALMTRLGKLADYPRSVTETLSLSLDKLTISAKQFIYICSYMSPDKIPLEFFARQRKEFPQPFCDDFGNQFKVHEIIFELLNYSLMKRDGDFLDIHRLVQEIVRDLPKGDDTDWLGLCLDTMVATMPDLDDYGRREPRDWFELVAVHAAAVATYASEVFCRNDEKEKQTSLLCHILGIGYNELAQYEQALECLLKALDIREKVLGFDHPSTAALYNNIALVDYNKGDYSKALEWHLKALDIKERVLGVDHQDTANSYNNIANVYGNQGDYSKALEWNFKALDIREKVQGVDHPDTAITYNNIALVYKSQGDYTKALEWYLKALVIKEKVLGFDHPSTAGSYHNIAGVYDSQGDYSKALELNLKALDIREKVLGVEHPDTAQSYNDIANVYDSQGDYSKALEWNLKALAIREKVLGVDHQDTATSYNSIASVYYRQGDYSKALEWYLKALDIYENVLSYDHPDTATSYNSIALVYKSQGDYSKALEWYLKGYKIYLLKLGEAHPYTITCRDNMERAYNNTIYTEPFDQWLQQYSSN